MAEATISNGELPVAEIRAELAEALRTGRVVLVEAPTGSGKSTRIPQYLVDDGIAGSGMVTVLEPRRLAARMLAARVAHERGSAIGGEVGYQIRFERRVSKATRIEFVTEGVLTRRLAGGDAPRNGVLVFDEFHERHLEGDLALALALQALEKSPDLRIVVMSATLDLEWLRERVPGCRVIRAEGRLFPVEMIWGKRAGRDAPPVWDQVAAAVQRACTELAEGHVLAFLPGAYEIRKTAQSLERMGMHRVARVLPLYGELPPEAQDAAVLPSRDRKIILSTNVAETSLTIDGVTAVVDAGLAKMARFDPVRGINTLLEEKISHASAEQRAGRAGRTAAGKCYRLWSQDEHGQRPLRETPEVHRVDISEALLMVAAMREGDAGEFPWIEAPLPASVERARELLRLLQALDGELRITETGKRMLRYPVHPRFARMLIEARDLGCEREAVLAASLVQGRPLLVRKVPEDVERRREDRLGGNALSDFGALFEAMEFAVNCRLRVEDCAELGIHAGVAREVVTLAERIAGLAGLRGMDFQGLNAEKEFARCVLAGFPDHLAVRLDAGTLRCDLSRGRRGTLARESAVRGAQLIVPVEIRETRVKGNVETILSLATAVELKWLDSAGLVTLQREVELDLAAKRVVARAHRVIGDLIVETGRPQAPSLEEAASLLAREVVAGRARLADWDPAAMQWIYRLNGLAAWMPELELTALEEAELPGLIEQACYGAVSLRELSERRIRPVFQEWLNPVQHEWLAKYAPVQMRLPNGRTAKITYESDAKVPAMDVYLRDLVDVPEEFTIASGRVALRLRILAPNGRPVQVTTNLKTFWKDAYPAIKAEMKRRYPKHPMP